MELRIRNANTEDLELFFRWKNEPVALQNSFHPEIVSLADHTSWFLRKIADPCALILVFETEAAQPVGHVRFETAGVEATIGITVDPAFRGKKLGSVLLETACNHYFRLHPGNTIAAFVKIDNLASCKAFRTAGFTDAGTVQIAGYDSFKFVRTDAGFHG